MEKPLHINVKDLSQPSRVVALNALSLSVTAFPTTSIHVCAYVLNSEAWCFLFPRVCLLFLLPGLFLDFFGQLESLRKQHSFDHQLGLFVHVSFCLIFMGFWLTGFSFHLCREACSLNLLVRIFLPFLVFLLLLLNGFGCKFDKEWRCLKGSHESCELWASEVGFEVRASLVFFLGLCWFMENQGFRMKSFVGLSFAVMGPFLFLLFLFSF